MLRNIIAVLLIVLGVIGVLAGVGYGIYYWGWVCIVGSIVNVINQIKAPEVEAMVVAVAILKFFWAGLWGFIAGILACIPGVISFIVGWFLIK